MSSRNVIARHRSVPVGSSLSAAVQTASGNAGFVGHQAGVLVAASHLTLVAGSPVRAENVQRKASVLSGAVRAHSAATSQKAKSTHTESSAFYTLR